MHSRRLARSLAFQTLFELESRPEREVRQTLADRTAGLTEDMGASLDASSIEFAQRLVEGALRERAEMDRRIAQAAPAFPIDQIAITDRVALELAVYELQNEPDVPVKVAINEAVELAKTYGGENSGRFVNGVLGTIAEDISGMHSENAPDRGSGTRR